MPHVSTPGLYATGEHPSELIRHWYAADVTHSIIKRGGTPTEETLLDLAGSKL